MILPRDAILAIDRPTLFTIGRLRLAVWKFIPAIPELQLFRFPSPLDVDRIEAGDDEDDDDDRSGILFERTIALIVCVDETVGSELVLEFTLSADDEVSF